MNTQEIITRSSKNFWQKWSIAVKVIPLVVLIAGLKFLTHYCGWEVMELNALFTSLIAGTIFLIGFLISGVLSDYKESEKIPSELTATLHTIIDDAHTIYKIKNSETAKKFLVFQKSFINSLSEWFYKKERTKTILKKINMMNDFMAEFDKEGVQVNYIIRLKNEQHNLRKMILRIHTIKDTSFITSAYAIVEIMGVLIGVGLLIMKIEPFYASLFFTLLVTFLISYMILLIRDLDDPFDYSVKGESGTEISLKPFHDLEDEIKELEF